MTETNPLYNIVCDVLGQPKKYNETTLQGQWNCIHTCLTENNDIPDGKGNLEISLSKFMFHCWKCEWSGSIRKIIKKYGSKIQLKTFDSLIDYDSNSNEKIIKQQGPIHLPKEFILFKTANKNNLSYKESHNYLINRGLDDDIIEEYNIGYCSEGKYENRIIFPSYNIDNKLNYFVARSFTGNKIKYKNPPVEKLNIIINEKNINWDSTIYLVEGVFDMIGLYPIKNIIPLIGKVLSDHLYYSLIKKSNGYICVVLDEDAKKEMYQIYKKLHTTTQLKNKIRVIDLPKNSDLSNIRRDFGKEGIVEILKTNRKLKLEDYIKYEV